MEINPEEIETQDPRNKKSMMLWKFFIIEHFQVMTTQNKHQREFGRLSRLVFQNRALKTKTQMSLHAYFQSIADI